MVGKQTYQYSLYSHAGDVHQGMAFGVAQATNTPFLVFEPQAGTEVGQTEASYFTLDQPNIVLSALYAEQGAIRIRLYENAGKATRATVSLPFSCGRSRRADQTERREDPIGQRGAGHDGTPVQALGDRKRVLTE